MPSSKLHVKFENHSRMLAGARAGRSSTRNYVQLELMLAGRRHGGNAEGENRKERGNAIGCCLREVLGAVEYSFSSLHAPSNMPRASKGESTDVFQWPNDEVHLMLAVSLEYKTQQAAKCVDWESIRNKYQDILELHKERLPASKEEIENMNGG